VTGILHCVINISASNLGLLDHAVLLRHDMNIAHSNGLQIISAPNFHVFTLMPLLYDS